MVQYTVVVFDRSKLRTGVYVCNHAYLCVCMYTVECACYDADTMCIQVL